MDKLEHVSDAEFVFGALLVVANKMDTLLDRVLIKYNVTSKQWFLLLVVMNLFDHPPTLKEAAKEMGSSHQNVKQLALKLQKNDLLRLEKDGQDQRITRLVPTEKGFSFWTEIAPDGRKFMEAFYTRINEDKMYEARQFLTEVMKNLSNME